MISGFTGFFADKTGSRPPGTKIRSFFAVNLGIPVRIRYQPFLYDNFRFLPEMTHRTGNLTSPADPEYPICGRDPLFSEPSDPSFGSKPAKNRFLKLSVLIVGHGGPISKKCAGGFFLRGFESCLQKDRSLYLAFPRRWKIFSV